MQKNNFLKEQCNELTSFHLNQTTWKTTLQSMLKKNSWGLQNQRNLADVFLNKATLTFRVCKILKCPNWKGNRKELNMKSFLICFCLSSAKYSLCLDKIG